jgi:two-component system cell cycle response regulator CtrA
MHLLVAEPHPDTSSCLELMLRSEGFRVRLTAEAEEADYLARHFSFDLVTLEPGMEGGKGWEVLRGIRRAKVAVPVILVSGLAGVHDVVRGLDLGADDYLTKPFHKDNLVARIRAVVRRARGFESSVVEAGPLRLDLASCLVEVDGQPVHLTGKEYGLLELLVLRRGQVVAKDRILDHLYGGRDEPELKIVDVFACKLRRKLADAGAGGLIETEWGRGYVLRAPAAAAA